MSSFPLTNSIIFQDGYCTTNQNIIPQKIGFSVGSRVETVGFRDATAWNRKPPAVAAVGMLTLMLLAAVPWQ